MKSVNCSQKSVVLCTHILMYLFSKYIVFWPAELPAMIKIKHILLDFFCFLLEYHSNHNWITSAFELATFLHQKGGGRSEFSVFHFTQVKPKFKFHSFINIVALFIAVAIIPCVTGNQNNYDFEVCDVFFAILVVEMSFIFIIMYLGLVHTKIVSHYISSN